MIAGALVTAIVGAIGFTLRLLIQFHLARLSILRYGICFLDNGRGVGYWIVVCGFDPPLYGYWIMSKDLDDLRMIVNGAMQSGSFEVVDVARRVTDFERGA